MIASNVAYVPVLNILNPEVFALACGDRCKPEEQGVNVYKISTNLSKFTFSDIKGQVCDNVSNTELGKTSTTSKCIS